MKHPDEDENVPNGLGEWVRGVNYGHMCHNRNPHLAHKGHLESSQTGALSPQQKAANTEPPTTPRNAPPTRSLSSPRSWYLWTHAAETGTLGLRFLQNLSSLSSQDGVRDLRRRLPSQLRGSGEVSGRIGT